MICGENSTINGLYQQVLINSQKNRKGTQSDHNKEINIELNRISDYDRTIRNSDNSDQCSFDS